MENLIIGSHVSFTRDKQLLGSVLETISYGSNAFMIYTGAPQNTMRSSLDLDLTSKGLELMKENNIELKNVVVHAPYIINLANNIKPDSYAFAINFLKEEIKRSEFLGIDKIVLHPGSHVSLTKEEGLINIVNALNEVITPDQKAYICLETMAGKGSELGITFEEIKYIIDNVKLNDKLKVCLDTCHIHDAGYDLNDFDKILEEFDNIVGIDRLAVIHINDSKNEKGASKDRHDNIGFGYIGFDNLIKIIYHDKLKHLPKILETPYIDDLETQKKRMYPPYKFEIETIKNKQIDLELINKVNSFYK